MSYKDVVQDKDFAVYWWGQKWCMVMLEVYHSIVNRLCQPYYPFYCHCQPYHFYYILPLHYPLQSPLPINAPSESERCRRAW